MIDPTKINIQNKRVGYEFEIIDRYEAGIVLRGSEIKAIRGGGGSISEAFCLLRDGELFIKNMNIPEYSHGGYANHVPVTMRKLLLTKRELGRIDSKVREKGLSILPLRLFINERGYAKLEVGVGRGKKKFDKRDSLKEKDTKRDMDRAMKKYK
ncbi:MAG TPA: SsrA-binding protein SmpB [Chitinophagales bacterium]|nr:SsrA-binding protein SmpB [Chitinophagales bacterium]HLP53028.1 SsrA-binding protein SmpB [Chitinophagales bacterium]